MFYFDDKWKAFTKKATYTEKVVEYDNDTIRFQGKDNLVIEDIALTDEQLARLEQVRHVEDMGIDALTKYVMTDELPVDNPSMVEADKQARTRKAILLTIDVSIIPPETLIKSGLTKEWKDTEYFMAGEPITNDGVIYKVLQSHAKQPDWTPDKAVSLFAKILTSPAGPLPWVEPGSTNPYMLGDKVIWTDGKIYESTINNNVWSPAGLPSGWYTPPVLEEWSQKTYPLGAKVFFKGKTWESIIANNSWSPSAYPAGWKEVS